MVKARVLATGKSSRVGCTYKHIKHLGLFTFAILITSVVSLNVLCNVLFGSNNTFAAPVLSTTSLTITTTDISTSFTVGNSNGTFTTSTPGEFTISTNNYTGYTLNIAASPTNNITNTTNTIDDTNNSNTYTKLINTNQPEGLTSAFNSISSASAPEQFNVGNWGFSIAKTNGDINSTSITDTTLYQPAPDLQGTTLDITNEANTIDTDTNELIPNTYNITLGIKADYETPVGTYANTYIIEAVANNASYTIYYNANTEDEVTNLPDTQSGDTTATSIALASTTPERAHYSFLGWCTVTPTTTNGVDSCEGTNATTHQPNDNMDLDQTISNTITLYAMWKIDTFTLTINKGDNISDVTGAGTHNYGEEVTLTATKTTDTTCVAYNTPVWSITEGNSTLSSDTGNNTTITIVDDTTISVSSSSSNKAQTITLSRSGGASGITIAGTSYTGSSVSLNCSTYNISGSYSSGYTFSSWSRANDVTVANTGAASTIMTVSGPGTLTLTGKASCVSSVSGTMQAFNPSNLCSNATSGTLTDSRDGKSYSVAKIGSLWWMTKNLAYASGASKIDSTYGGYYDWANARSVCPSGWSLPTRANYDTLRSSYNTGPKLVAAPWYGQYGGSYFSDNHIAGSMGSIGRYWSSTEYDSSAAYHLVFDSSATYTMTISKSYWILVRCVH